MQTYLTQLQTFERILTDDGFATRLHASDESIPYDVLLVGIGDEDGEGYQLELTFIPEMEEELDGASLLQCFVQVPAELADGAESDLMRLLNRINGHLPLVGFCYLDGERMLCYRHVLMIPNKGDSDGALVKQTAWMISYLLSTFGGAVASVAAGSRTIDDVINDIGL